MFNWILSITVGLIVAFAVTVYMITLGLSLPSIIVVCFLVSGYSSAVVALMLDRE